MLIPHIVRARRTTSVLVAALLLAIGCAPTTDAPTPSVQPTTRTPTSQAQATASDTEARRLVVAIQNEVAGFDPRKQQGNLPGVILEPLVTMDSDFTLRPRLATAWEIGDEGRVVTLRLREGVTFHDGRPFTSEDVRFTIEAIRDGEESGGGGVLATVTAVETPDPATVVLHVEDPLRAVLVGLATVPILPSGSGPDVDTHPIGTGPFSFVRHDAGRALLVERFEGYWGPTPDVSAVEFRVIASSDDSAAALARGTAHLSQRPWSTDDQRRLDNDRNVSLTRTPGVLQNYLAINALRPPFDDLDVRRALNHLIPRERIVADVYGGNVFPSASMLVANMPWFDPETPTFAYDVERARDLVATSGAAFDRTYRILTNDSPSRIATAEALVTSFARVGMRAEVEIVSFTVFTNRVFGGDFDMHLLGMTGGPDVAHLLANFARETGFFNTVGFSDPEAEAMLRSAAGLDPTSPEAVALYRDVANRLVSFSAIAFLTRDVVTGASRVEVEGWRPHPVATLAYQDLHQVRLR